MLYFIYRKIHLTSLGLEVSNDQYALIAEANIDRYEMINTISVDYPSVVVAVSKEKYFLPLENRSYTLEEGLKTMNILNSLKIQSLKEEQ